MMNALRIMQAMDMSIEEVDALTGATLGWPKSGTFRLSDMVGIDVLAHVAKNFFERVKDERPDVAPPPLSHRCWRRSGWEIRRDKASTRR
jgi:3-hydroxyacyl-CoA dehydrogenase